MKFSFSTLGCPRWTLNEILSAAKDLGYAGVELRGLGEDIFLPDAQAFKAGGVGVKNEFSSRGLEVSCISTECMLHKNAPDLEEKVMAYIRLAASLGCKGIRLLGDTDPWKGNDVDVDLVAKNLARFTPAAEENDAHCVYVNRAFAYAIKHLNYNLWGDDNAHTNTHGAYLAVCTFYATLFGKSATELDVAYGLPMADAKALQEAADKIALEGILPWAE